MAVGAALIGVVVAGIVYLGMALNVWTVIHSGRTVEEIHRYYRSMYIVPPVAGLLSAVIAYRVSRRRAARRK